MDANVKIGTIMMVQVERPRSTDWVLGAVSAIFTDKVQVQGTVISRIERDSGQFVEPDVSATVIVPMEHIGTQEAEVLS